MSKPDWLPANPCPCGAVRYPDSHKCYMEDDACAPLAKYEGGIKYQKELLAYQKKLSAQYSMPDTYSAGIPIEEIDKMLKELEK